MIKEIAKSELILNEDGSIYHINLKPEHIADTVILVGDQDRVSEVSKYFDEILFETQKREFKTCVGVYKGKKLTVISTGIGPDNIDIVLNEIDALINIDLETREIKKTLKSIEIVRIGTSGALDANVPVDSFLASEYSVGLDGLNKSYNCKDVIDQELSKEFIHQTAINKDAYIIKADKGLFDKIKSDKVYAGMTATCDGFYGPQGRVLRLELNNPNYIESLHNFEYKNIRISNFEMETSAIYLLSSLLGHKACSVNAIIANRTLGEFSKDYKKTIDLLIEYVLEKLK
ncbi:MAG: nucleoside phosphorylase [Flavobacteriaceae bacterium]|nr:nucleoside phosphorylase [Flavobacteriaceae bacterium]